MHKFIDYSDTLFTNFKVINQAETRITINPDGTKRNTHMWNCKCLCGNNFIRDTANIKRDKPCRICSNKIIGQKNTKTNINKEEYKNKKVYFYPYKRLKTIWYKMKDRCYNPKCNVYKYYGERGISICDEWLNDYLSFETWALEYGYEEKLSIDRIENQKGYSPSNCKWSTRLEQQNNLRRNVRYEYRGEMLTAPEIGRRTGIPVELIYSRLYSGYSVEEAISMG